MNKPFLSVTIDVTEQQARKAAWYLADSWFEYHGKDAFALLGMTKKDLENEVMSLPAFAQALRDSVTELGREGLHGIDEYDYIDWVEESREMKDLEFTLGFLKDILFEIDHPSDACADAIETLRKAGFRVVRD